MRRALLAIFIGSAMSVSPSAEKVAAKDRFPACTSEKVLNKLVKRFNKTERIYWQQRGLVMDAVFDPHQHVENPFPDSPINRRYCHGDAVFENGKKRRMHYLIEEGAGFAGFVWNVEYCIHGLDPHKYYDGRCRVLSRR